MTAGLVILLLVLAVLASTFALIVRGVAAGSRAEREWKERQKGRTTHEPVPGLTVRPVTTSDEAAWRRLWDGYCFSLGEDVPSDVTQVTWTRLLDETSPLRGFLAFTGDGTAIGMANVLLHPHTWSPRTLCYLEDLYVDTAWRGRNVGYELISSLWKRAEDLRWGRVYWHTGTANAAARRLYDRFRPADSVVRYTLTIGDT